MLKRSDFSGHPPLVLEIDGNQDEIPDYLAMADSYADGIATGHLPGARPIRLAAQRYLDMREKAERGKAEFVFSPLHVIDYCLWIEKFRHIESGMWELTQRFPDGSIDDAIYLEPWQIWIEAAVHGFRLADTGERLVTTALELVPRKNAKTSKLAPGALYEICCSGQRGAQVPIAASSATHAEKTLYGMIGKVIDGVDAESEALGIKTFSEEYDIRKTKLEITSPGGTIWPMTSMGRRQDGLNPSLALFEEGHAGNESVWKVIDSAFGARPNALRRMITTAGYEPMGPAWELQKQAMQVIEGNFTDDRFFAAIYTLDKEDYLDPQSGAVMYGRLMEDEALVAKANPMYGTGLDPRRLAQQAAGAKISPKDRIELARTRFNIWVGSGHSLIDVGQWAACKRPIRLEEFIGLPCWFGVDLATKLDMCAIAIVFQLPDDMIAVFAKFFLPENSPTTLDPDMQDQFRAWADGGDLVLTPGVMADHVRVQEEIVVLHDVLQPEMIVVDPHQALGTLRFLDEAGLPVRTYKNNAETMTPTTNDLLARIAAQKLFHDGNPVLAWNAQNVHGEPRGNGSIVPRKDAPNSIRKIDGFVAACFANGVRIASELAKDKRTGKTPWRSAYENPGRVIGLE